MVILFDSTTNTPSSPVTDTIATILVSELSTPFTPSGGTSPTCIGGGIPDESAVATEKKKKKKKKSKKSGKSEDPARKATTKEDEARPPVLCISRNKHWRYISSYHGPWLQLPVELLDSLLTLNLDPTTLTGLEPRSSSLILSPNLPFTRQRERGFHSLNNFSPPDSPRNAFGSLPLPPLFPPPKSGKITPPPIDPGVFRSVRNIRGLIDEAAELSVRASSGLSATELSSMRSGSSLHGNPWATAQSLGLSPLGNHNGGGRNVSMSPIRIHRLRALAVQKLAQAYKTDEIASSVMVMQGGSVFDDLAERVLRVDPNDVDAKYVHFFHEKIPSRRQLAESTTTAVLDDLIAAHPQCLEYYRTRGIVHCFREEFFLATKDFTYALKEARAIRKAKFIHHKTNPHNEPRNSKNGKCRKAGSSAHTTGQAPFNGTSAMENGTDGSDGEPFPKHPSVSDDAPEPIEPQLLFLRGATYLQQAVHMIETSVLKLEGVCKPPPADVAEVRLSYIENGRFGGVEVGNPDGPLGAYNGEKLLAYSGVLGENAYRDYVTQLLKKALRDHEKFISHFASLDSSNVMSDGDLAYQMEYAFYLSESMRPGSHTNMPPPLQNTPAAFATYHPLLVESYFSILICQLMLADFAALIPTFIRTAFVVDGLEGYPIFLPPRSMAQAEFIEVLERLAGGWKIGTQPHSLSTQRGKCRLAVEAPRVFYPSYSTVENTGYDCDYNGGSPSSSSTGQNSASTNGSSNRSLMPSSDIDHISRESEELPIRPDASEALDSVRILLAPVVKRQRERAERLSASKLTLGGKKKPVPINIPLHGPRVEVILAWLGAVHLPELGYA
ncbi:hypothetical protein HYPSUDRAFT_177379 [Hypholoma sublateritium FD-334 SS-4]|uniref:Uncharacterized protein n=1 Tax=Hypholoma sublateritium (strain FD-334 SS-4) TaxID=945553 RepID=A0A0D2MWH6_HYPSF|nr:hypothetical protein HYPSUDRAFT_177379 [Hypholoma sublateritium FD-334 SS-4]